MQKCKRNTHHMTSYCSSKQDGVGHESTKVQSCGTKFYKNYGKSQDLLDTVNAETLKGRHVSGFSSYFDSTLRIQSRGVLRRTSPCSYQLTGVKFDCPLSSVE